MAKSAQDFDLETIDIVADNREAIGIKFLVVELNLFEDLFSFVCSGSVVIKDALGIIENLKLDGSEIIRIRYGKSADTPKDDRSFRLYKVGNRIPVGNKTSEHYTLYFTSEELFLSEQIKITKSFKGLSISDMIWNILIDSNNGLDLQIEKIKWLEQSYGTYDMLVPKMKPLEAISWLSNYAIPNSDGGADMIFYQTKDGFYFNSLKTLFNGAPVTSYKYQPSDLSGYKADNLFTILDYEFIKTYDSLEATNSGIYANRLISIDPISRKKTITDFSKSQATDGNSTGTSKNKFGKYSEEMYESRLKLVFGNSAQVDEEYIKQSPGSVAKNIRIETTVPHRTAQLALANYTTMKAIVPGNNNLTVGRTLDINLNSLGTDTKTKTEEDAYYSGTYLITGIRHIIQTQGVFQTVLELAKNSMAMEYPSQTTSLK